jgi:DNA (cytosine-5)-methyltransferase 1
LNYVGSVPLENISSDNRTGISLFTGVGGMDIGFAKAGYKTRVMIENDPTACLNLRKNFHWNELKTRKNNIGQPVWNSKEEMKKQITWYHEPEPVILEKDITKLKTEEILNAANLIKGEPFIVFGGPPCQGFSTAGKRILEDPRNQLIKEFFRVVKESLPRTFLMENVPGMVSMAKGRIIKELCEEFAYAGYDVVWNILNAADYGVPQTRKRVLILGVRNDALKFPEKGNPQLFLAAQPGNVKHPDWFLKRYDIKHPKQKTLDQYSKTESFEQFLQKSRKNKIWSR